MTYILVGNFSKVKKNYFSKSLILIQPNITIKTFKKHAEKRNNFFFQV